MELIEALATDLRPAGRLRRDLRSWSYDAPISRGDALRRDGRADEAIDLMRRHLPDLHRARLRVLER